MRGRAREGIFALVVAALCLPATAQGTVTIGSNLARAPDGDMGSYGCAPSCTLAQETLAADRQAAGGLTSPVNGTVVLWRVRAAGASGPTALRVITPLGGALWRGAGRSDTVTPTINTVSSFATGLPIARGDSIGIDCCRSPPGQYFLLSGGTEITWNPALEEGGPGTTSTPVAGPHEIALNADIEPTSAFTIGKVKPGKGGKVTVTATLPNPGVLVGGDARDKNLAATAAGNKVKYLKRSRFQIAAARQTVNLLMKPTKAARQALDVHPRVKAKLKLVYTPTGGSASTQVLKVKLKR